ncbi:MAG: glycerol-3-phosphate acyltransferase [Bacteroidota bacterium]|nr:glycerol-3-phosphate acyltransferase [Bacteroidota bacterium]
MTLILICIVFYLIGSFPTAYILVKLKHKKELTREGSGNIGARNTFEVTNSKLDGGIVLAADFLKGLIPVLWFFKYAGFEPQLVLFPSLFLLIGHNYSVWLKFKGGRGLATGAGIMIAINFTVVLLWLLLYFIINKIIKNVHVSTVIALILLPVSILLLQDFILGFNNSSLINLENQFQFLFSFISSVCIIILLKHISPILEIVKNKL